MAVAATTSGFDRLPPQNLEAERGVLGSVLLMNEVLDEVVEVLAADHFYTDGHRKIFSAIRRLYDNGTQAIDPLTLAEELDRHSQLDDIGGASYLEQVLESVPHAAHARYYAGIVREKWVQRQLIFACNEILSECYDGSNDPDDVLSAAEQRIFRILDDQGEPRKIEIKDILLDAFDRINERMENDEVISGIPTGFPDLDQRLNGLQPSELVVLAARPSMGKTALVCNLAEGVAMEAGQGVLLFSLEQSNLELAERLLCIRSQVNSHRLRSGTLDDDERKLLVHASAELSEAPLFLDDQPGRTIAQITAVARRLQRRNGVRVVIIDYLQLIEPEDKSSPREQQIALITRRLKALAKELSVPVIALAQLNRGVEHREDKRPRLSDLRESGAIEQDADVVMFLHRPEHYNPEDRPGEADVIIAKNRNGPTDSVTLTWIKESMRFTNFSRLDEPDGGYFADSADDSF
ncbi:MAG: replicative DNA helicase [Planctomycetota bacterium]|nr:replicative DNA helicase [Planctomycetota bacterium]MEE3364389.1 replicative DNA helicase [Planctomycetota bacterium]